MKNKKIYLSASLALLAFASCTNDMQELETNQPQLLKQIVMTTEDFLSETGSRTLYDIADGVVKCTWASNDTVGVFPDKGAQAYFPMASGAGTKNATFDGGGWALKDGSTYGAYYPCIGKFYLDKHAVPVSYEGQTQVGNASMAHLGAYDYMVATPVAPEFGSANFMFKHMSALVQLKLTIPEPATLTSMKLVADTESFAVMGKVDIMADAPSITAVTSASEVELTLQEVSTTEEDQVVTLYLMLPPADLSAQTLKAVVTTDKGTLEMALENKNFQAGKVYALSGEMKGNYKNGVATLVKAGTLQQLLGDDWLGITSLKVVGPINGDDVRCLRQMLGGSEYGNAEKGLLATLDLSNVSIVGGGGSYYETIYAYYHTTDDMIGQYMFSQCGNLRDLKLPNTITEIDFYAFYDSASMTSLTIGDDITSIAQNAFTGCSALTSVYIEDLSAWCNVKFASMSSSPFFNKIAKLYLNDKELTELVISEGITEIRNYAFYGCKSLVKVTVSGSVTSIGDYTFYNCESLTSVTLGESVTSIGYESFMNCSSLASVTIGNRITSFGDEAFRGCSSLTSVTIGESAVSIGFGAFMDCTSLTSIHIPDGVEIIPSNAFYNCTSLATVILGKGVTEIYDDAFFGCSALKNVYCYATTPPVISIGPYPTFEYYGNTTTLYVPSGCVADYQSSDWGEFFPNIKGMGSGQ